VEAMAVLQNGQPRIVFLDIRLPKVDGLQILHYIYDSAHLSDTRVFIITAHKDYADTISLRNGDMYLLKPIAPSEIRDIVSQALIQP
jgi:two-component system response regulator YesN